MCQLKPLATRGLTQDRLLLCKKRIDQIKSCKISHILDDVMDFDHRYRFLNSKFKKLKSDIDFSELYDTQEEVLQLIIAIENSESFKLCTRHLIKQQELLSHYDVYDREMVIQVKVEEQVNRRMEEAHIALTDEINSTHKEKYRQK